MKGLQFTKSHAKPPTKYIKKDSTVCGVFGVNKDTTAIRKGNQMSYRIGKQIIG